MKTISIVIPALNEEEGIGPVLREIPISTIKQLGYEIEILVIDNGSTDCIPQGRSGSSVASSHFQVLSADTRGGSNE